MCHRMLVRRPRPASAVAYVGSLDSHDEVDSRLALDGRHDCKFPLAAGLAGSEAGGMLGLRAQGVEDEQSAGRNVRLGMQALVEDLQVFPLGDLLCSHVALQLVIA